MTNENTLEEILESYDWARVFADENAGNVDKTTREIPPGSTVDLTPPNRTDIEKVLASVNGENDGPEWLGLFQLKDGRFLVASGVAITQDGIVGQGTI